MTALSIQPTFPIFTDIDGQPLENGYIWIGTVNLNPQTNPINVYWDAALTIPAVQPIRTLAGYPSNSGTPARLYVNSDYSIRVQNRNGSLVYSAPAATERYGNIINAEGVVYDPPFTGAVQRNVEAKLAEIISVKDFGAVGDGTTDDSGAVQDAVDYLFASGGNALYFPDGTYYFASTVSLPLPSRSIRMYGTSSAGFTYVRPGGSRITGASGLATLFLLTSSNPAAGGNYGLEIDHLDFNGNDLGVVSAIKNVVGGSPARPVSIHNCQFNKFQKALSSDITSGTPVIHPKPDTPYGKAGISECEILPHIDMWTTNAQGRRAMLPGWLASQTDMLSEDWEIV